MSQAAQSFTPRLMPARAAAHYLGVSESTLRGLKIRRKQIGTLRPYDKADLDAWATGLAYEGDSNPNEW